MSLVPFSEVLLWFAVTVLGVLVLALARQVGLLHERIAPAGALTLHQTVKPGDVPQQAAYPALDGTELLVGGKRGTRSQLLFFTSPHCPICKGLFPILRSAARSERDWVDIVLASDGEPAELQAMMKNNQLEEFPLIVSEALGRRFGVSKLPYALLFEETGVIAAMGLINSREHLESLFEAKERGVASLQQFLNLREGKANAHVAG